MSTVGVRELRDKLSQYLSEVRNGKRIEVTSRGEVIALLIPAKRKRITKELLSLVEEGSASWAGGKPSGSPHPVENHGRPLSDLIAEDRR